MAHIELLDQTLRDGPQSLWGMKMQAGMALPVAPNLDRAGFHVIDLVGSSMFEVLVRYCQEDPWEGLDLLLAAMPRTPVRGGMRSNAAVSFSVSPDALMDMWMRQLNRHGCRSFWIFDLLYNVDKMHRLAGIAKQFGSEVAATVMYSESPVHTDEYFVDITKQLVASDDVDTILFYDPSGVLDVTRLRTVLPAVVQAAGGKPVEFHSNNLLGISGAAYIESIEHGVSILHTATRPMANGNSVPSTEIMAHNLEILGHTHGVDVSLLPPVAHRFEQVAAVAGFPVNQHNEYDVLSLRHQIPGGMMGSLRRQLADYQMEDLLPQVLSETARVRAELGYPVMATPFSQLVGTQAVLNVVTGQRYGTIPDQVIQYAGEVYGRPVGPIQPDVLDRILGSEHASQVLREGPSQPSADELRRQYGTSNDDDLILAALVPEADLARMRAAGPVRRDYPTMSSREMAQVAQLVTTLDQPYVRIATEAFELELRK
jgi:oxaloacetate decarboxylase alpha subunit